MYFRCFDCEGIWTKIITDGCPSCDGPCQIIEDSPHFVSAASTNDTLAAKASEDSGGEDLIARNAHEDSMKRDLKYQARSNFMIFKDNTNDELPVSDNEPKKENTNESAQIDSRVTPLSDSPEHPLDSAWENSSFSSYEVSDKEVEEDSFGRLKPQCGLASPHSGLEPTETQESFTQEPAPDIQDTNGKVLIPSDPEIDVKGKSKMLSNAEKRQKKANRKKNKKLRQAEQQQQVRKPVAAPERVQPQLEKPDPIPEAGESVEDDGWKKVMRKEGTKGLMGRYSNVQGSSRSGKFVNATAYDFRRDFEDEGLSEDYSALDVRFGIGSAKHDVRRIIPRSALE